MSLERYGQILLLVLLFSGTLNGILSFVPNAVVGGFEAFWFFVFGLS